MINAPIFQKLFRDLISYVGGADQRVLSAFGSYIFLRQRCSTVASLPPAARASDHAAAVAEATAAAQRYMSSQVSRRGQGLARRDSGNWVGHQRGSSPPTHRHFGADGNEADDADYALTEVNVPVSLINLVVHADQRRAPLRMLHFADALPSLPPPPPPPPSHNTPSPRLLKPILPERGRDSGELGLLPPTTEDVAAAGGGGLGGAHKEGRSPGGRKQGEEATGGASAGKSGPPVRLCATCEVLPIVRIGDGNEATTPGNGAATRGLGEQAKEGDSSANEQVSGYICTYVFCYRSIAVYPRRCGVFSLVGAADRGRTLLIQDAKETTLQ